MFDFVFSSCFVVLFRFHNKVRKFPAQLDVVFRGLFVLSFVRSIFHGKSSWICIGVIRLYRPLAAWIFDWLVDSFIILWLSNSLLWVLTGAQYRRARNFIHLLDWQQSDYVDGLHNDFQSVPALYCAFSTKEWSPESNVANWCKCWMKWNSFEAPRWRQKVHFSLFAELFHRRHLFLLLQPNGDRTKLNLAQRTKKVTTIHIAISIKAKTQRVASNVPATRAKKKRNGFGIFYPGFRALIDFIFSYSLYRSENGRATQIKRIKAHFLAVSTKQKRASQWNGEDLTTFCNSPSLSR